VGRPRRRPDEAVLPVPAGTDPVLACSAFSPAASAHAALHDIARVRAGETVLVTGAAGAVGGLVVQLAARAGARVLAVVSREAKRSAVPAAADEVLVGDELEPRPRADVLVDTVGGPGLPRALAAVVPGGRAVLLGSTAGRSFEVDLQAFAQADVALLPLNLLRRGPGLVDVFASLLDELSRGELVLPVERYALGDAPAALARLRSGEAPARSRWSCATPSPGREQHERAGRPPAATGAHRAGPHRAVLLRRAGRGPADAVPARRRAGLHRLERLRPGRAAVRRRPAVPARRPAAVRPQREVPDHRPDVGLPRGRGRRLLDSLGIERADFVCNSWGGTIALALAAALPDRVRALVVTGSMPVFHGPLAPLPEQGRRGRAARDAYYGGEGPTPEKMRALMARLEWYDATRIPEATVRMRYEQSVDPDEVALAGASDSPRGEWQDLSRELERIAAPVLFAWGMHDAFLTPDYPLMLARMVPRGHLYVMDAAGHHLQEERPEDYHAVVSGWLAQSHG
jgi:pimeloyl-ACP methyl ester carboxylesterase